MDTEILVKAASDMLRGTVFLAVAAVPLGAVVGLAAAIGWLVFRAIIF